METSKLLQSIAKHKDIVTCLALGSDGRTLVTGSRDTTLMVFANIIAHILTHFKVWDVAVKGTTVRIDEVPKHILYGHDDEITCVAVNVELGIACVPNILLL